MYHTTIGASRQAGISLPRIFQGIISIEAEIQPLLITQRLLIIIAATGVM
jgi:hypothetical protein